MYLAAEHFTVPWHIHSSHLVLLLPISLAIFLVAHQFRKHDGAEPPYIYPYIPLIGHIIGMMRYGAKYFEIVKYGPSLGRLPK